MKEIRISKFKTTCRAVVERVQQTVKAVLATRFGEPAAEVFPPQASQPKNWVGTFAATGRVTGDIVSPASDDGDSDALR